MPIHLNDDGTFPSFVWTGGHPIYYLTKDGGVLCPKCANKNLELCKTEDLDQWFIEYQGINWEDQDLRCDNCNCKIEVS